jgi:hypothetical protein
LNLCKQLNTKIRHYERAYFQTKIRPLFLYPFSASLHIKNPDGEIYISFWESGRNYSVKPEQKFKNSSPDPGYGGPVLEGM